MGNTESNVPYEDAPKTRTYGGEAASMIDRKLRKETSKETESTLFRSEPFADHYTIIRNLGQPGGYAHAAEVIHNITGEHRAVKIISKTATKFRASSTRRQMFVEEMKYISDLNHPNIVKGYEAFEDDQNIYLVMELCTGGELYDKLKELENKNEIYTESAAARVIKQLASAIQHMHKNGVAHCDLKPDNFLFASKDRNAPIKIIDFNLARHATPLHYFHSMRGTKFYMAPEVYSGHYTYHCDMWSLGTVAFLMLFGYPPFFGDTDAEVEAETRRGFLNEVKDGYGAWFPANIAVSSAARDFITKLLCDPVQRLTATEALEHPWLTGSASSAPIIGINVLSNLQSFLASCKFKCTLLYVLAESLPSSELKMLKRTFQDMDENSDGYITIDELKHYVSRHPNFGDSKQCAELLRMADVDGDGKLCYTELVMASVQKQLVAKEERLWNVFCELDEDGDREITIHELRDAIERASFSTPESELQTMMDEIDENNDGKINYEEFLHVFFAGHHEQIKQLSSERHKTNEGRPDRPSIQKTTEAKASIPE